MYKGCVVGRLDERQEEYHGKDSHQGSEGEKELGEMVKNQLLTRSQLTSTVLR